MVLAEGIAIASSCVQLPLHMKNDSKYIQGTPACTAAELLMYRIACVEKSVKEEQLEEFWQRSTEDAPCIYRKARALKLPVMKRVVNSTSGDVARGTTLGLSYTGRGGTFS